MNKNGVNLSWERALVTEGTETDWTWAHDLVTEVNLGNRDSFFLWTSGNFIDFTLSSALIIYRKIRIALTAKLSGFLSLNDEI